MEDSSREKDNVKATGFLNWLKRNIAVILIFAIGIGFVSIEMNRVLNVKLETQTAVESVVYDTIEARAVVIRNERVIENKGGAVTVPLVENGEKVKIGGEVAMQFASEESAQSYSDYLRLQKELDYYVEMEKSAVGQATDVQSLDKDILDDVNALVRGNARIDTDSAENYTKSLNNKFTRRQLLVGSEIDFSAIIKSIREQMSSLGSIKPSGSVNSDSSGIFMQYTDGLEGTFDYANVRNLDVETINSYIEQAQENESEANNVGKIINDFDWYFCTVVSADKLIGIENGDKVDITLKNSSNVLSCKIVSGAETTPGQKESALILQCSDVNGELASLRLEDIEIRIGEHRGIKMPLNAVHVKDGEKGVYALVASVVEWRKADILYTGEDYVILTDNTKTENGIKLYDEIIIRGKDLHDGKVYA